MPNQWQAFAFAGLQFLPLYNPKSKKPKPKGNSFNNKDWSDLNSFDHKSQRELMLD
jgi:hypothetical protein